MSPGDLDQTLLAQIPFDIVLQLLEYFPSNYSVVIFQLFVFFNLIVSPIRM